MSNFVDMYYEILLPLKLNWYPTYSSDEVLAIGERVIVSFAHRDYVGVVLRGTEIPGVNAAKIQAVSSRIPGLPHITEEELYFWKFISEYYLCTLGEVYRAAYPKSRIDSEMVLVRKKAKSETCPGSTPPGDCGKKASPKPEILISVDRKQFYLKEAVSTLANNKSALVLVPEKAFGDELCKALKAEFGDRLRICNSRQTAAHRRETAQILRSGEATVVLGTRSSIFLPFNNLGLIIVDEEQDYSHKQTEPNPRYNGRDCAVVLGKIHGARVILGSAAPSFETLYNLSNGKYSRLGQDSPSVPGRLPEVIDISAEKRKRGVTGDFSYKLIDAIKASSGRILLVRGWENEEELRSQVSVLFPEKEITILNQTAALATSGHFGLIAVMQADALFDRSDFRADEKILQFLSCISGKCDRMVVQTNKPEHPAFNILHSGDPSPLLEERKSFRLPPFTRIIDVLLKDTNPKRLEMFSGILAKALRGAIRIPGQDGVAFRITVSHSSDAASVKRNLLSAVDEIEKRYRYSGHIHIDVDPV